MQGYHTRYERWRTSGSSDHPACIYINLAVQCASATEQNYVRFAVIRPKGQISTTSVASLTQQVFSNQASSATQWLNPIDTDIFNVYMDKQKFIKPTDISGVGSHLIGSLEDSLSFLRVFLSNGVRAILNLQEISISLLSQIPQRSATQVL